MKKMMNWVLVATLCICGASVFTSCSNDNSDNSGSIEQAKNNRKEFVVQVHFIGVDTFRFQEQRMLLAIGKGHQLRFDGWTVAWANGLNLTIVER